MRHVVCILVAVCAFAAVPARAGDAEKVALALAAARSWLALTDAGEYSRSWDQAAGLFQAAVSKPDWERAIRSARAPLGNLESREIESTAFTRSLPGAPDGEYVVIRFRTRFENKANAIETVTPLREKSGSWKVSGYFIR